ncbi:MAG: hypothetical protein IKZ98_08340 [Clostridia bacterium]|nr:hypothetical protein [Clostridia bacterium]
MQKRLTAFLLVMLLAISAVSMALADVWLDVYTTASGGCVFDERGDWSPQAGGGAPGRAKNTVNMVQ